MPSLAMYKIAPPTDPAEFENICMDFLVHKYNADASLYGRKGQAQKGIDIIVTLKDNSYICAQCKDVKTVCINDLKAWIAKVDKECIIPMKEFVILVAVENDARLQEFICIESENRIKEGKTPVKLTFWDDVIHFIKKDPNMLRMYYPEFYRGQEAKIVEATNLPEQKYPERIIAQGKLRNLFFDETVKYRVEEFLSTDPRIGVDFELVGYADACIIAIRNLLFRAPMLKSSDCYYDIENFLKSFIAYCDFFPNVSEAKGPKVFAINRYCTNEEEIDLKRNDELRIIALENYNIIKSF